MGGAITLTEGNFDEEVLRSPIPVLIDFWASWCVPCKTLLPSLDQIAGEYEGRIKIAKVNIGEEEDLAVRHGISGVPTFVVYKDGAVAAQKTEAMPKRDIEAMIADFL